MIIIGAKGFAVQLHDVIHRLNETKDLIFFDDQSKNIPELFLDHYPIIRTVSEVKNHFNLNSDNRFALGVGGPSIRKILFEKFTLLGGTPINVISKDAIIGSFQTTIGVGVCILPYSVIESTVKIGNGTLININVLITHNSIIGDFCELSPGVTIAGGCQIGNNVFLGTGAIIMPGIKVGNNSKVGAGAVVNRDVSENSTVVGVPAKSTSK